MNKFKVATKKAVDEQALAAFSDAAETHSIEPVATLKTKERATESFLLRLTPSQVKMLDYVFQNTNVKSKQKLVESILIPELEAMQRRLQNQATA
jgi:hypothetical protein